MSNGAGLGLPREVLHYPYVPEEAAAAGCSKELAHGWNVEMRSASPERQESLVLATRLDLVLTPHEVRSGQRTFEALARRFGGTYDGWEASV